MNSHRLRLVLFAAVSVVAVVIAGVRYVGIPERYLGDSYAVSVNLPDSGGIFPNAEVTLRGISVGRVTSLHLTPDGIRVDLRIKRGVDIPEATTVQVANLSAVGEQYVDMQPTTDAAPYLEDGAVLPISAATLPPDVPALMVKLNRLATSVGTEQLARVVHELGDAFADSGEDLATVLTRSRELSEDFTKVQPTSDRLLRSAHQVLGTQRDLDPTLQRLSRSLDTVTAALAKEDPALRSILDEAPATLTQVRTLLATNQAAIGVLLGNLLTVSEVLANPVRLRGLNTELVLLPKIVQGTFNIQPGDGYARLGAVVDTSQRICTQGYESSGAPLIQEPNVSAVPGNPSLRANVNASCTEPASAGVAVRGAANVPRPAGDDTARVRPTTNPRGFGARSSFRNEQTAGQTTGTVTPTADSKVRMVGPTDLRGLLLKGVR